MAIPDRVELSPEDYATHLRLCQETLWNVQEIQGRLAREIAAAQAPMRAHFLVLVEKYYAAGLRPDVGYRLDPASHSFVIVPPDDGRG